MGSIASQPRLNSTANPRRIRLVDQTDSATDQPPYDVSIAEPTDPRTLALRAQLIELSTSDPHRFVEVLRDAQGRERAGIDPIVALELALGDNQTTDGSVNLAAPTT